MDGDGTGPRGSRKQTDGDRGGNRRPRLSEPRALSHRQQNQVHTSLLQVARGTGREASSSFIQSRAEQSTAFFEGPSSVSFLRQARESGQVCEEEDLQSAGHGGHSVADDRAVREGREAGSSSQRRRRRLGGGGEGVALVGGVRGGRGAAQLRGAAQGGPAQDRPRPRRFRRLLLRLIHHLPLSTATWLGGRVLCAFAMRMENCNVYMIAVPYFGAGRMENFGILNFDIRIEHDFTRGNQRAS
jgi:hypothetical protein